VCVCRIQRRQTWGAWASRGLGWEGGAENALSDHLSLPCPQLHHFLVHFSCLTAVSGDVPMHRCCLTGRVERLWAHAGARKCIQCSPNVTPSPIPLKTSLGSEHQGSESVCALPCLSPPAPPPFWVPSLTFPCSAVFPSGPCIIPALHLGCPHPPPHLLPLQNTSSSITSSRMLISASQINHFTLTPPWTFFLQHSSQLLSGCHVILPTIGLRSLQDLCSHRIPKHLAQCLADGKPSLPQLNRKEGREGGKEGGRKSRRERGIEGPSICSDQPGNWCSSLPCAHPSWEAETNLTLMMMKTLCVLWALGSLTKWSFVLLSKMLLFWRWEQLILLAWKEVFLGYPASSGGGEDLPSGLPFRAFALFPTPSSPASPVPPAVGYSGECVPLKASIRKEVYEKGRDHLLESASLNVDGWAPGMGLGWGRRAEGKRGRGEMEKKESLRCPSLKRVEKLVPAQPCHSSRVLAKGSGEWVTSDKPRQEGFW